MAALYPRTPERRPALSRAPAVVQCWRWKAHASLDTSPHGLPGSKITLPGCLLTMYGQDAQEGAVDKDRLLTWLKSDAQINAERYVKSGKRDLSECLFELNNRRAIELPSSLPKQPEAMLRALEQHYRGRVSFVSLVLSRHFPDRFLFYRVSQLDREILEGLAFFGDVVPEFRLPFDGVGDKGLDRYLQLNESLQAFARTAWPDSRHRPSVLLTFLYQGLGLLFLEKSSYNRYWLMASKPEYFHLLDGNREIDGWSGHKEMKRGDLVFMYRTSPRKAITNIYRVKAAPWFDPWGAWHGFWVDLTSLGSIPDISFAEMRHDPLLREWGPVRRQFQWTRAEAVPHSVYNQLLDRIPEQMRVEHGLRAEPLAHVGKSGEFTSEADFEDQIVKPLLQRWRFRFAAQHPCTFHVGSQETRGRVDFHVSDGRGPLTLFENKLRIVSDDERNLAVAQAKSYALLLGLPSFVVASPEGLWIYSLARNVETLRLHLSADEPREREESARSVILSLRT